MRRAQAVVGIGVILVLLLAACGVPGTDGETVSADELEPDATGADADADDADRADTSDDGGDGDADDDASAAAGGTLTIAQSADLPTLDPHDALGTPYDRVFRNVFNRLFVRTDDMEVQPELVTDYENVDDETWVFQIRDDVVFHNGDQLTAADVAYSLERVSTDDTLRENVYFTPIVSATATDEFEVEVVTDGPLPTMEYLLAKSGADILPSGFIEENGLEEFVEHPFGSGPYEFIEWRRDDRVILEPFDDFWGDAPQWDEVIVRGIPESSTRTSELVTGGVDIITDVPPLEWDRVEAEDGLTLMPQETTRVMILIVRTTEGYVTEDPAVREAIDLAIDQGAIVDTVLNGAGVPVRSRVPEGVFGSNPETYDTYVHDLDRATELVEAASGGDPIEITLTAPRGRYPLDAEVAELVGAMLENAGFAVDLDILESGAFLDKYNGNQNEELIMIGLADGLLDASYSLVHYTEDRAAGQTDYSNPEVEEMFHRAGSTLDQDEREELYHEIQAVVAEERPHIFLYQQRDTYAAADGVSFTPRLDDRIIFDDITVD